MVQRLADGGLFWTNCAQSEEHSKASSKHHQLTLYRPLVCAAGLQIMEKKLNVFKDKAK